MLRLASAITLLVIVSIPAGAAANQARYFPKSFHTATERCGWMPWDRPQPIVSDFEDEWYSKHLQASAEPSLYERTLGPTLSNFSAIRFTWLRSFHPTIVIRIEQLNSSAPIMTAKQLSGAGGYDAGKISLKVERRLMPKETNEFKRIYREASVFAQRPVICTLGLDGAEWIVEGVQGKNYRYVSRWSPEDGPVRQLGLAMLKLTGWTVKPIY
jgi:hypothetical protein